MIAMMLPSVVSMSAALTAKPSGTVIPTRFVADRVYAVPQTVDGRPITLFTDSGGGLFITEPAARRLKLTLTTAPAEAAEGQSASPPQLAELPAFKAGRGIPLPPDGGMMPVMPEKVLAHNRFDDGIDGMLGQAWFGGRVWTWDYPNSRLTLEASGWKPGANATRVALGFPVENGQRANSFPRIAIRVDGKPIDLLLDTGATTTLTPAAMAVLHDSLPPLRATSMIVDAQFQQWRAAHPDWRVIDDAQEGTHSAMIEVPQVEIAGSLIGPVWFTWRPDKNFHGFMSSMMDQQVEGAIGGNAFSHFVMTVDYPGAAAWFLCVRDCERVAR